MSEDRFHTIITEIYDNEAELVKKTVVTIDGDYEVTEMEQKYHDWLDERRKDDE